MTAIHYFWTLVTAAKNDFIIRVCPLNPRLALGALRTTRPSYLQHRSYQRPRFR